MRKILKKKVNVFGKKLPVFVIALMGIALVSAALLGVYGNITGSGIIEQSVIVTGGPNFAFHGDTNTAGKSFTDCGFSVKNNAEVEAPVILETTCTPATEANCNGITTEVWGVVELSGKSNCYAEGMCTLDTIPKATVYYTIVGDELIYKVESSNIVVSEYTLVYYPDIGGYASTDYTGYVIPVDEITESLPMNNDLNKVTPEYCTNGKNPVGVNCYGAKLWLIPTSMINFDTDKIIGWNGDAYLFETDLITYTKTTDGKMTIPAGNHFDFCVDNDFALNLVPDTYTIDVSIVPQ